MLLFRVIRKKNAICFNKFFRPLPYSSRMEIFCVKMPTWSSTLDVLIMSREKDLVSWRLDVYVLYANKLAEVSC